MMFESKEAFAQSFKAKNPDYKSVPDSVLADKLLAKYPQYQESIIPKTEAPGFMQKAAGKVAELGVGAVVKASELGEKGIKAVGRTVTPKQFEERLGFAEEPTANEQLFGEGGFDAKRLQDRMREVSVSDIVQGAKQGFQEAGESIERRGEIMNPIAEQKGILGEGAMKTGKGILNVLDYASKTIGGAVAPVITPVIEETIASMTPESQQQLQTSIEDLTAKFEALPPEQQEGIRSTGILGEALTAMIGTPFVARGAKQAVKAGRELATEGVEQVTRISEQVAPKFAPLIQKVDDIIESPALDEATIRANLESISKDISREYFNQVSPSVQRELLDAPELKDQYTKALVDGYIDETAPSLLELGATRVKNAIDTIEGKIKATGNKLGDFREKISTVQVQPTRLDPVLTKFDAELGKFGLKYENGAITEVSGRKTKLSPSEIRQLEAMRNDLIDIKASPTAQMIIDVRSKIDSDINFAKDRRDISSNLDGIAKSTRADLAKINREVIGKEQSAILERYSDLQDLIATYRKLTSKGNNIEFFLKRIMSERGRQPKSLTNLIKEETGTDLFKDALIIDNLVKDLAPDRMKSRFAQELKDSGVDAGLVLTALVSPQAAASKFAADQTLNIATKFLRTRFGKNAKLNKALDDLQKNDEALLELRKMLEEGQSDVKGWSNVDDAGFKKVGSTESALLKKSASFEEKVKTYINESKKQKGTLIIDSDKVKESMEGYTPKKAPEFHEESSKIATQAFKNALKDDSYTDVEFMAGGSGSGKSEVYVNANKNKPSTILFDGTFADKKKAVQKLEEALASGKNVSIKAIYAPIEDAWRFANSRDRFVPRDVFIEKHTGFRKTIAELAKEYPNLKIDTFFNSEKYGAVPVTFKNRADMIRYLERLATHTFK